jgi:ferredoxin
LCLHACPTGVFAQANPPESQLSQVVAGSPSSAVELACPLKEPADLSQVPEASVVQTPRCLAALSVPAMLDLAMTGKRLWLNDGICHACPIGQARWAIQRTIITANRWLQVMGHAPTLRSYLTTDDELADEPVSRPVARGDRPTMSRRDFFSSLTRLAGQTATNVIAESDLLPSGEPPSPGGRSAEGGGHRMPHHIPAQRQHLAHALRRLSLDPSASIPTAALPIADVTVTDDCTACGLCAQFCPTEAITFVSDDEYYVLKFSAALCLGNDCSLCDIGCPTNAVLFGQEVTADELLSTQPRPVKAGRLASCAQCGAPTAVADETDEAPLCYVCQAQANRPSLMTADH